MAVRTADITPSESIKQNLSEYVLESETPFAESSKQAVSRFMRYLNIKKVVDLGCGDGAATPYFKEAGVLVIGVDINSEKLKLNPTKTIQSDMVSYLESQKDNAVPNIFIHHALEHVPNPQKILDLIKQKLKVGGWLYIEVPAKDFLHSVHHATFDSPEDLLPEGFEQIESGGIEEHYLIARKV